MKIVYGGSFNPPTLAHLEVYKYLHEKYPNSEFVYLPVSNKYQKEHLLDNEIRYEMLSIMIEGLENCSVSKIEFNDEEYLGTYNTLKKFNDEVYFVLGADLFLTFKTWRNLSKLIKEFKFIILSRDDYDVKEFLKDKIFDGYLDHFIYYEDFKYNISSTSFRNTNNPKYLTKKVYEYIKLHNLYDRRSK